MNVPSFVLYFAILSQVPSSTCSPITTQLPDRGEGESLIQPRTVVLDYQDTPMSEVIKDISAKTGCRLSIYERKTNWLATRITLRTPGPVPFWTAVNLICEAGRFGSNLGSDNFGNTVAIFRDSSTGPAFVHGVFRVQLKEIYFRGQYGHLHLNPDDQAAARPIFREEDREQSHIGLEVWVEPRLTMRRAGKLKGLMALDEHGQSLIPANEADEKEEFDFGFSGSSRLGQISLERVEKAGKVIKTLRGIAPVVIASLRPDALVIPLLDVTGRSFRGDQTVITINEVAKKGAEGGIVIEAVGDNGQAERGKTGPSEGVSILLTIRPIESPGKSSPAPEVSEDQFEVVDPAGKVWSVMPSILSGSTPETRGNEVRFTLLLSDQDVKPLPWPADFRGFTLRYRELIALKVDVSFEFKDVPLP